jgi:hypothetical protein
MKRPVLLLALVGCSSPAAMPMTSAPDAGPMMGADSAATPDADAGPTVRDRCVAQTAPQPPAPLRTLYVDGDNGSDAADGKSPNTAYKTLTKANASAIPGDLYLVKGTFTGQYIRPSKGGTAANPIVFRAMPNETPKITQAQYGTALWLVGMDWIVVEGFELTGNTDPASLGNNDWMRGCKVHDNTGYIRIIDTQGARVEDNDIPSCGTYCFWMSGASTKNQILRNTIGKSTSSAFMDSAADNTIAFNDFANVGGTNLSLNGGSDSTTVECNTFRDAGTMAAMGYYTPSLFVSSNKNLIRFNIVKNNLLEGMGFWIDANENDVLHNVVVGNGGPDIRILVDQMGKTLQNNLFRNNVFWDNNKSSDFHWNYNGTKAKVVVDTYHVQTNGWVDGSFGGNVISHNLIGMSMTEAGKGWLLMIGYTKNSVLTLSDAQMKWPMSIDSNFELDPLFTADLHPTEMSPVIDKGEMIQGIDFSGAAPDLGRFEYLSK